MWIGKNGGELNEWKRISSDNLDNGGWDQKEIRKHFKKKQYGKPEI